MKIFSIVFLFALALAMVAANHEGGEHLNQSAGKANGEEHSQMPDSVKAFNDFADEQTGGNNLNHNGHSASVNVGTHSLAARHEPNEIPHLDDFKKRGVKIDELGRPLPPTHDRIPSDKLRAVQNGMKAMFKHPDAEPVANLGHGHRLKKEEAPEAAPVDLGDVHRNGKLKKEEHSAAFDEWNGRKNHMKEELHAKLPGTHKKRGLRGGHSKAAPRGDRIPHKP